MLQVRLERLAVVIERVTRATPKIAPRSDTLHKRREAAA